MSSVQVESVYYGQAWSSSAAAGPLQPGKSPPWNASQNMQQLDTFLGAIVQSGYMDGLKQYGVSRGSFLGRDVPLNGPATYQPNGKPTQVTEAQITSMLNAEINTTHSVPTPNANQLYMVFLPPNMTSATDVANNWAGHHSSFTDSAGHTVYYAVIPHPTGNGTYGGALGSETTFQDQSEVASHELAEAVTDPSPNWKDPNPAPGNFALGNGYVDRTGSSGSNTIGDEIGDIPQGTLKTAVGWYQGYIVAMYWSNAAGASVLPPGGQAAVTPTGDGWVSQITAVNDSNGDGYLFGVGSNHAVYYKVQQSDGSWSAWQDHGTSGGPWAYGSNGQLQFGFSSITASSDGRGWRVFGIDMGGSVWTRGSGDSGWHFVGKPAGGAKQLAVGFEGDSRMDLFAVDANYRVDEAVANYTWGPTGWENPSFQPIHAPGVGTDWVTVNSIAIGHDIDGRQEVFGTSTWYNDVWVIKQTVPNGKWGEWSGLVTTVNGFSQIATGRTTDGRLELFGIARNHALYTIRQTSPGTWAANTASTLGGYVKQITVVRKLDGREEVLATGSDDTVWAIKEVSADDGWTESNWYQVTTRKAKALVSLLNYDFWNSAAYGEVSLALINPDGSVSFTSPNGGWF
jgi:hypothetical protein